MVKNPPDGMPRVTSYLHYEDAGAAIDFLVTAFGFAERVRMRDREGRVVHAELTLQDGLVMLGWPGPEYQNPRRTGTRAHGIYVYVDDVDTHFARARAAGAEVVSEPVDQFYGDRSYTVADPEGHHWTFGQHVRDVSPEECQAQQPS